MKKKNTIPKRKINPMIYLANQQQRDNMFMRAAHKAHMLLSMMVLHDKFDFGTDELNRYVSEYTKQLDAYNDGYVESVKDFEQVLWDECGIKIDF